MEGINVIIPIGGVGHRFREQGFRFPKPLINIVGRPMLFWVISNLVLEKQDTLWIAISEAIDQEFQVGAQLTREFLGIDIRILPLRYDTRGAAETLFLVVQAMPEFERGRRTISLDCDTIYFANVLQKVRDLPAEASACVYFTDDGDRPVFSYISLDKDSRIVDIKEKVAISRNANTGCYVFATGFQLHHYTNELLDASLKESFIGEYYTSAVIAGMIGRNVPFYGIPIAQSDFACVGTPHQLEEFLQVIRKDPTRVTPRRFCFDLDSTLVTLPTLSGDYSTVEPIEPNIALLRELKLAGHYIIIQTARRMKTHHGNVGKVIQDVGPVTFATLAKFDIPFDELHFGKPWAHVYVDDLAVNAMVDTRAEIGWSRGPQVDAATRKMVLPRNMNTVQIVNRKVIKSAKGPEIVAEAFYYCHVPDDLCDYFPRLLAPPERVNETTILQLQLVEGTTFAHLIVNRGVTSGRLNSLLTALNAIHQSNGICIRPVSSHLEFPQSALEPIDYYGNYSKKLEQRYTDPAIYIKHLGDRFSRRLQQTMQGLRDYESKSLAVPRIVIHGDPVFSNIIFASDASIKFLDPRGALGGKLTVAGDGMYDLAKVYQSLLGYDFVMMFPTHNISKSTSLDQIISQRDREILQDLQKQFFDFIGDKYGQIWHLRPRIRLITASLLVSMLPYHDPIRWSLFIDLADRALGA
jgi:capsule biosynthesis phosphatase